MKTIARQAITALPIGGILLDVLWLIARLLPPAGILLYFPTVVGLEVLEDQGYKTLQGSPDGWPVPTALGLWIAGVAWWLLCSLAVFIVLHFRSRRQALWRRNLTIHSSRSRFAARLNSGVRRRG